MSDRKDFIKHFDISYTPDLITIREFSSYGDRFQRDYTAYMNLKEQAVREALIKLGWTPPKDKP